MSDYGNGHQTYEQRNARAVNLGEQLFEAWCKENQYECYRLGYDEKTGIIPGWHRVAQTIRQMPDYLVKKNGRMAVVSVKGTLKFKEQDYKRLDWYEETYATPDCPFRIVIARPSGITWLTTEQVQTAYETSGKHGKWPDGKIYRELNIERV